MENTQRNPSTVCFFYRFTPSHTGSLEELQPFVCLGSLRGGKKTGSAFWKLSAGRYSISERVRPLGEWRRRVALTFHMEAAIIASREDVERRLIDGHQRSPGNNTRGTRRWRISTKRRHRKADTQRGRLVHRHPTAGRHSPSLARSETPSDQGVVKIRTAFRAKSQIYGRRLVPRP